MYILIFLLKIYMIILIFRSIFTSQELYFNPFGKLVASFTEPIFANLFKGKSKAETDKFIPLIIFLIILLQTLLNKIGSVFPYAVILLSTFIENINFLTLFIIVSIILGGSKNISTYYSVYFYRIGLPWVKFSRRFIKISDNRIILPTILVIFIIYLIISGFLYGIFDYWFAGSFNILAISMRIIKITVSSVADILFYLTWLIIIRAFISWVNPDPRNPIVQILYSITEPILIPFKRIIPPLGFIDISAIVAILIIQVLRELILRIL